MFKKYKISILYFSSGSSDRVEGGRETLYLCGQIWQPSFLWLIFAGPGRGAWPPRPPHASVTAICIIWKYCINLDLSCAYFCDDIKFCHRIRASLPGSKTLVLYFVTLEVHNVPWYETSLFPSKSASDIISFIYAIKVVKCHWYNGTSLLRSLLKKFTSLERSNTFCMRSVVVTTARQRSFGKVTFSIILFRKGVGWVPVQGLFHTQGPVPLCTGPRPLKYVRF